MANILSHAYKGALFSSLIAISYSEPIDTIEQMVDSGLPFYVPDGTILVWLAKTDPRDMVKKLNERRVDVPYFGGNMPKDYLEK